MVLCSFVIPCLYKAAVIELMSYMLVSSAILVDRQQCETIDRDFRSFQNLGFLCCFFVAVLCIFLVSRLHCMLYVGD